MKKLLTLFLSLILIASLVFAMCACDTGDNGDGNENDDSDELANSFELDFTLSDSGTYYIVTGFGIHLNSNLTIPAEYEGLPVREIGKKAFTSNLAKNRLESIVIPSSIEKIGDYAFSGCTKLSSITLNSGLTYIGEAAFRNCDGVETVIIPDTVTYIGDYAFDMCSSLKNVTLSAGLSYLGNNPFRSCSYIIGNNASPFGGVYTVPTSDGKMWIVSAQRTLTDANLPDNTVGISAGAFNKSTSLATVEIPKAVRYICKGAFASCTALTTVNYGGSASEWLQIAIGDDNIPLLSASRSFAS